MSARIQQEIRERFDLDKPIPIRYLLWLKKFATGDLGNSLADDNPVIDKIKRAF